MILKNNSVIIILTLVLFVQQNSITCIKILSLDVPAQVMEGSEVKLSCLYDLGNASLYSLKWLYRKNVIDEEEFYRYRPLIRPVKQVFPLSGIKVDFLKSDGGAVVISQTNRKTSGFYKCEISVEGTFRTVAAEKLMTVIGKNRASVPSSSFDNELSFILYISRAILSWIASHY